VTSIASVAAQVVLLAAWVVMLLRRGWGQFAKPRAAVLPVVLAVVALWAHLDFFHYHGADRIHRGDFYVYYVTTKYFPELGYTGLYEATTVADYEDVPERYSPSAVVRSLQDYSLVDKSDIIRRRTEIVGRFSPRRWGEFKADIAVFRDPVPEEWWKRLMWDHGYNGTPVTTALYGFFARHSGLSTSTFLAAVSTLDMALLFGCAAWIGWALGGSWGVLFVFLFAANPLNDYHVIGGSYLRYTHFFATALAITALLRGQRAMSGAFLALAAHLRVSPLVFLLALTAGHAIRRDRWKAFRDNRRLYLAFAASALVLVLPTAFVHGPDGQSVWSGFARKVSLHSRTFAVNHIGIRYPFLYSQEGNVASLERAAEEGKAADWREHAQATFERHRPAFVAAAAGVLGLTLLFLRRIREDQEALFAGVVCLFVLLHPSHYEFMILSLVPFMFPDERRMWVVLGVALALVGAVRFLPLSAVMDARFLAMSLIVGAYLVTALCLRCFVWRPARGGTGAFPIPTASGPGTGTRARRPGAHVS